MSDSEEDFVEPGVYDYMDYAQFLQAWFTWRCWAWSERRSSDYSFGIFARRCDVARATLPNILAKRRNLTQQMLTKFRNEVELTEDEARYLLELVELSRAKTAVKRREIQNRLLVMRTYHRQPRLEKSQLTYFSAWWIPAVHELARCQGFKPEAEWVASALRPAISVEQATEALELLERLDLLDQDHAVTAPVGLDINEMSGYYQGMAQLGQDNLEGYFDKEQPELSQETVLGGVTFSVCSADIPRIREQVFRLQKDFFGICASPSDEPHDRVFQFSLQLFPISEHLGDK